MIWKRIIFRGHPRSLDPKSGVFRVIPGQGLKIFKPGQIIDQNEALGRVDTKNGFRGHPKQKKTVLKLPRAKREAKNKRPVHEFP